MMCVTWSCGRQYGFVDAVWITRGLTPEAVLVGLAKAAREGRSLGGGGLVADCGRGWAAAWCTCTHGFQTGHGVSKARYNIYGSFEWEGWGYDRYKLSLECESRKPAGEDMAMK
jgi:hypothetical protein